LKYLSITRWLLLSTLLPAQAIGESMPIPSQAIAAGYGIDTYDSEFDIPSVDLSDTKQPGFQWYLAQFFGKKSTSAKSIVVNRDGSLTLSGDEKSISIGTAGPAPSSPNWVGLAFGGGAYFEATIRFDPANTLSAKPKQWPAFWSMAIEHLAPLGAEQWVGQASAYTHFIEPDFFEYDSATNLEPNQYGGAIHEWYGVNGKSCPGNAFCQVLNARGGSSLYSNFRIRVPANVNFRTYHKFGFLWVPARAGSAGYAQYYFDNIATTDRVEWREYSDQPPPPGNAPWTFGIIDRQHLVLMLSTGAGQPMTVRSVRVFQKSKAANLEN
jgi:hypothetical protein